MRYSRMILGVENGERKIGDIIETGGIRYRVAKEISRAEFAALAAEHNLKLDKVYEVDGKARRGVKVDPSKHKAARCQRFYRLSRIPSDT